ncbi:AmpG family muropeptide MFS transporter [Candidatus Nitrospira neomarina]|uniref:AmpG family muropeptide MFS transporter n=1 Tax=Candidatus Nitrospira neomarina TaxID=3020899 RepID=A0AA96GHM1_9BACT|nr:AmpG family muropeptide MFS transporter [Candidatus Nitrospira neomarina]WNM60445.1 AmpG family muropeptide MFS transporter [Candidatus Nitrospira neomarina]
MTTQTEPGHWLKNFCLLLVSPKMLVMLLTGFSSGLPLLLIGSTLKFWMREEGLDLTTIGFFGLVGLPYTLKFLWAPVMDRLVSSALGRRRGWMLGTQIALMLTIASLALTQPAIHLSTLAVLCVLVAFFSASQDIVLDAYRRECLSDEELGIGSSMFIYGYRLGMLTAGALALFLADQESLSWNAVYFIMGAMMSIGILTTWFAPEPTIPTPPPASWQEAITGPFLEFFSRPGALMMLLFILLYKVGDSMASEMLSPFMVDLGVSKTDYAMIVKVFGMIALMAGGLIGGLVVYRMGIVPSLFILGFLQMISTAGFVILAYTGNHLPTLTAVIAFETISSGLGQTAFVAFMASLTNKRFTATQYALLTSFMGIPRVFAGSTTGFLATWLGWEGFFLLCTLIALPGLFLIPYLRRLEENHPSLTKQ